jgi:hypothetical protein
VLKRLTLTGSQRIKAYLEGHSQKVGLLQADFYKSKSIMAQKNKKQFGVWMDSHQATIVGRDSGGAGDFMILAQAKNSGQGSNSNENASNNAAQTLQQKFFKEITSHMQNIDEIHVTGTGKEQEQFIKYMADTPQFKNAVAKESTTNKMSDEKLVEYIAEKFN